MFSNDVVVRLKQKNWYVTCRNKQEAILVLQACDVAGIRWLAGEKPTGWYPFKFKSHSFDIGFLKDDKGITTDCDNLYEIYEAENITDWFFKAIKGETTISNDSKLIPQNEEQEHLVQMLLAKLQGIPVEYWSTAHDKWLDSKHDAIIASVIYRIKPTFNPETSLTERPEGV